MSSRRFWYAIFGILLLTALVHSGQFANPFLFFDDPQNVLENEAIRALTAHNLKIFFTTPLVGMYSPLVYLSYAIDYQVSGLDATAYHATNLALHLLNVVLVAVVVRRLTGHAITGAIVALLFGVHPMNVAGVAPLSVRSSLLCACFFLAAYLAYLSYVEHARRRWLFVALGCFVLAALSKSSAIVFPAVLLVTDVYIGRRLTRAVWLEKAPFVLISMGFAAVALRFRTDLGTMHDFTVIERMWLALYSVTYYVFNLAAPVWLAPLHPYPAHPDGHLPVAMYLTPLALVALAFVVWRWKSERRTLLFGGLFFVVNIVLVLKLVPLGVEFIADRYVYLPSIGLLLIAVELGRRIQASTLRRAAIGALAAVTVWFSAASYVRAAEWHDRVAFESRVLERYPDDPDAHAGLGISLADQGRLDEAIAHLTRAAELDPANVATRTNLAAAHTNLARTLLASDRIIDAMAELRTSLQFADKAPTHYLLGSALAELGQLPEAVAEYQAALRDDALSRTPELHNDLGVALGRLGRREEAIAEFKEALRLNPAFEPAKANLAFR